MRRLIPLLAALVLGVPAAAAASPRQASLFEAPRELLGTDAGLRDRTLDELQTLGVDWLRVVLYWKDVAPDAGARTVPDIDETDPAAYRLERFDALFAEAERRGLRVLLTVTGPVPRWATYGRRDQRTNPSPYRFRRFMVALGTRWRETVDAWSIWNEPNHPKFLLPQHGRGRAAKDRYRSAWIYRRLFQQAALALRQSGNAGDPVLLGETAPRGTGSVVAPLTFLRTALCLDRRYRKRPRCGRLPADGFAHHPYTTREGPWFRPRSADDVTIGVLSRLNRALARAGRAGAVRRGLPIWITEFGIQSEPDPFYGVSQTAQAEFRAAAERMAWRNRRVAAFAQYLMRDDMPRYHLPRSQRYSGFETGLRGPHGDPKRALAGYRLPLVARRVGHRRVRTHLWGLVRPAEGRTRVRIQVRTRGGKRWHRLKTDTTDARGAWSTTTSFRRNRRYRVVWRDRGGTTHIGPLTRVHRR